MLATPTESTVEYRGDASVHADDVGIAALHADPEGRGAIGHVGVQVNEARYNIALRAAHLDDAPGLCGGDVWLHGGYAPTADPDIQLAVDVLARVKHMAALH